MLKRFSILLLVSAGRFSQIALGQSFPSPAIEWQLGFGGTNSETLMSLQQTSDGGYIFGGYSRSPVSGNKTSPNFGGFDFWIVRVGANTNTLWQRSFGGDSDDRLYALQQTLDGGYILGGSSGSGTNGNKTSPNYGSWDFWVIRLDANGDKLWERSFGGAGEDELLSLQQTSDGGFILGGRSSSSAGGTKTSTNWGGNDYWIIRLNADGQKLWEQSYGGNADDIFRGVRQTTDGGFILAGYSLSAPSGTKTSPRIAETRDSWVVRVGGDGTQLWDRSYGASYANETRTETLDQASDDGFVVGGSFTVNQAQFPSFFWAVRIDAAGEPVWDQYFVQSGYDRCFAIKLVGDGGYLLGGVSFGEFKALRVDEDGTLLWRGDYIGGVEIRSLQQTTDGGFIVGGSSSSGIGGDKTVPNYGLRDFWIIKLGPEAPRLQRASSYGANVFRFDLLPGETNHSYRVDYSTNLLDWTELKTNRPQSYRVEISDTNHLFRIYRAERLP